MSLIDHVRRTIDRHGMADARTRVVLAVSGGSDSVALAHIASELAAAGTIVVAGLAHFNHQLRETAMRDEELCRALAERLGWPILTDREDVAARASREGRSIEDAARAARYAFFDRARVHFGADVVALGHTRDDQAETFLLRLIRGAGARGLAAMYPRNGWVVRPLLDCRRADLRAYLVERGAPFVEDETNDDVTIVRNRVRAELLPLLEARFNPAIVETLATEADLARDEWQWMSEAARPLDSAVTRAIDADGSLAIAIDLAALADTPPALCRLTIWTAMTDAAGGRSICFDHVAAAMRLIEGEGGAFDAPGFRVERAGERLVLTLRPAGHVGRWSGSRSSNLFEYPLSIPGEVVLPEAGCAISAEASDSSADRAARAVVGNGATTRGQRDVALVRRDLCRDPLTVRNRRPGDRFRPGRTGHRKKLQDFFVDAKVGRSRRDLVPIVVDGEGRIVWVAGYGIDAAFRVTDPAQGVIILRLRRV
jgi:tRNA(Ile)-lysidine synthase